jgi:hypothetical protein
MMPELKALLEYIQSSEYARRIEQLRKKHRNNYVAEAVGDAEFILKWRKQKKA